MPDTQETFEQMVVSPGPRGHDRCRVFNILVLGQTARSFINIYENSGLEFALALKVLSRVKLWVLTLIILLKEFLTRVTN